MASYGYTFNSGDGVTPTRLNAARTVSNIVNADIDNAAAIGKTKISGTAITAADTGTVTSAMIADGAIVNADINASAAIAHSKLANITSGQVLLGNASNVPTATSVTGDVTINNTGVTAIGAGVIVDADVNASAAIALSKLATGALPTAITVASANIVDGTIVDADVNASAAIALSKLATGALPTAITVASANIVDGTIVNADINNSAAIAHSKLANATPGQVLLGTTTTGVVTATALSGDVTVNGAGVTAIGAGVIVDADIASATITDAKLATISTAGKVSNSATTATNANTANAIVARDASGNFSAGTITASLSGNVTGNLTGTASAIADGAVGTAKIVDGAVTTAKLADANVTTAKLATTTQQGLLPAGAVMPFAMNSAPSGWLAADGSAVSRSTYAALFAAIGVTHGAGDSVTTFNLPDLRGIFVRGSGSQTIDGTTYNKTFAAKERDALQAHTHSSAAAASGSQLLAGGVNGAAVSGSTTGAINTGRSDSNETRPANIALLYCIKF